MHDLDRTQTEYSSEFQELTGEGFELMGELPGENTLGEVFQEAGLHEVFETGSLESSYELGAQEAQGYATATETELPESEEIELASELLEVTNEDELDQFLGRLARRAWRGIRRVAPGVMRGLGGALKGVARRALPVLGGALGTAFAGPAGGAMGSRLAAGAGSLFGLELEGLSNEDQEFEVARRFVRFASSAARNVATSGQPASPAMLRSVLTNAARRHAPGLIGRVGPRGGRGCPRCAGQARGAWYRRGDRITLVGV